MMMMMMTTSLGSSTKSEASSELSGDEMSEFDQFGPLKDFLDRELTAAAARKASFETRALALVTMNLGLFTLFFAVQSQISLRLADYSASQAALLLVGAALSLTSMVLASASAFPVNYPLPTQKAILDRFDQARAGKGGRHKADFIRFQMRQLDVATRRNQLKGYLLFASFTFAAAAILAVVSVLGWAAG